MDGFKQLLDVMLPANLQGPQQGPKWPTDRAGMEAERNRLVPMECRDLHQKMPDRMIVKMIEESFNEPFKTGPLIDQQGHYAIFDILMNRQMFDYITRHHLNTKAGQADNAALAIDFPAGENAKHRLGCFHAEGIVEDPVGQRDSGQGLSHGEGSRSDPAKPEGAAMSA